MPRRALLLGIVEYEEPRLRLPVVEYNLAAIHRAVSRIGFECQSPAPEKLSTSLLRRRLRVFMEAASPSDDIFVYITCHGAEIDNRRVLIPFDHDDSYLSPQLEQLSDRDLYDMARACRSRSVTIILDACREEMISSIAAKGALANLKSMPDGPDENTDAPTTALIYSCNRGELSLWDTDSPKPGYFTQAFCQALDPENQLSSLGELILATQSAIDRLLPLGTCRTVTWDERSIVRGRAGHPRELAFKPNRAGQTRERIRQSALCEEIRQHELWPLIRQGGKGLETHVLGVVVAYQDLLMASQPTFLLAGGPMKNRL